MELGQLAAGKPYVHRNVAVRFLFLLMIVVGVRFVYVVTIRGESCIVGDDFCFFSSSISPENHKLVTVAVAGGGVGAASAVTVNRIAAASPEFNNRLLFHIAVFQDLVVDGFLSTKSKSLCVGTLAGEHVHALREINVDDSVGIDGVPLRRRFDDNTFDFVFSGDGAIDRSEIASEIVRILKPEGYIVVHTASNDTYSFNSFIRLFNSCIFIRSREIDRFNGDSPHIHEIVMKKLQIDIKIKQTTDTNSNSDSNSNNRCSIPAYKHDLLNQAEPLIEIEPLKPWITLKQNIKNVKYLPSMADISFKRRYVYIDVGSRNYGSSIVSWFKKQYPKQNKSFDIYAIEADKHFHDQYMLKKDVTLLPYAAWVKNESLVFEINDDANGEKQRGMGRIRSISSSGGVVGSGDVIQGFDFAEWLINTVSDDDFVVMKMDVEGAEFDLVPRLIDSGAICLVDEVFLECHYNRWQKCCPGVRSPKYRKSYDECLELFASLRRRGVLVHQWW